jgi:hypothetical protein
MAHSFDVFDAAGTHACSCQSNGGLASNCSKMHCEIYFSIQTPESEKIQDLVARMSILQYILLLLLLGRHYTLARTCVGARGVKNVKGVSHLFIS